MTKLIQQISVFSENKPGKLAQVAETLKNADINLRAFTIAESGDFGIIRLIVDKPEEAYKLLKDVGFTVSKTDVLGVHMDDKPGSLLKISKLLSENEINMDYAYAFVTRDKTAVLIIRVSDVSNAISLLEKEDICFVCSQDIIT
ncbi:MAG: ACT domain-containing protein [Methanosarcinaceae archaeon]|nr:ACT domain-containing protein [Methanosarcinaceae archaeon]